MRHRRAILLLPAALAFTCAYHAPDTPPCTDLTVQVTTGTHPTFRWTPECRIERLQVTHTGSPVVCWTTFSRDRSNALGPPIAYGVVPPGGARTANRVELLAAGATYLVTLSRVPPGGGAPQIVGKRAFAP
jgi:hypothetical protein